MIGMASTPVLYEALLWEPSTGYFLLERHLERLASSAGFFGYPVDIGAARARLLEFAQNLGDQPRKVRLEASATGNVVLEDVDVKASTPTRIALATEAIDSSDVFLCHKTSRREVYRRALAQHPDADDVLLWNERHELTETCSANVVLEIDEQRLTPPLSSGLLPGTYRAHLLERGEIEERVLPLASLEHASAIFLMNSVRRLWQGKLASLEPTAQPGDAVAFDLR
jgi:para-aminobenzoate synthetase/4-amino-4-deoxychorismate lyase